MSSSEYSEEDASDCGDVTSTYCSNRVVLPPTQPDPTPPSQTSNEGELEYLVSLASSNDIEDKAKFKTLLDMAIVHINAAHAASSKKSIGISKTIDINALAKHN